jgi:hypothetical protein
MLINPLSNKYEEGWDDMTPFIVKKTYSHRYRLSVKHKNVKLFDFENCPAPSPSA